MKLPNKSGVRSVGAEEEGSIEGTIPCAELESQNRTPFNKAAVSMPVVPPFSFLLGLVSDTSSRIDQYLTKSNIPVAQLRVLGKGTE